MPRAIVKPSPIILKKILNLASCSVSEFAKILATHGVNISKTSIGYLINNGIELKRVTNFREKIERAVEENFQYILSAKKINLNDIWRELTIDYSHNNSNNSSYKNKVENKNSIEIKTEEELLNYFMEVTMLEQHTLQFFGLKNNPFSLDIKRESEIYLASPHAYALEVMKEVAEFGGFAVITGQVGSGKTTILSKFIEEIKVNKKCHIIYPESIDKTRLNAKLILQACVYDLTEQQPKSGIEALSRQVKKLLIDRSLNNEKTVIIIEEAHDLPIITLKFLKRIWEMKDGLTRLLGIILVGQSELETRLFGSANTDIREVTARVTHAKVYPIDKQVTDYITHRIRMVKGDIAKIITVDAISMVENSLSKTDRLGNQISFAYPLAINNIMIRLMNYCANYGEKIITADVINNINIGE